MFFWFFFRNARTHEKIITHFFHNNVSLFFAATWDFLLRTIAKQKICTYVAQLDSAYLTPFIFSVKPIAEIRRVELRNPTMRHLFQCGAVQQRSDTVWRAVCQQASDASWGATGRDTTRDSNRELADVARDGWVVVLLFILAQNIECITVHNDGKLDLK